VLEVRGMIPRGAVFGLLFGVAAWAVAGLVVMPIIGHISGPAPAPTPPPGIPTSPDPMHATFMMLHLGALAPVEALLAWLLFGAVLGAASGVRSDGTAAADRAPAVRLANPTVGLLGAVILATLLFAGTSSAPRAGAVAAAQPAFTGASTHVLGTGNVPMLPPGNDFVSVLELSQAAGATLGPHAGHTGFAYGIRGEEIIALAGGPTLRIEPGQAGFIGGVVHTHENRQGGLPAVLLALGLLGLGLGLEEGLGQEAEDRDQSGRELAAPGKARSRRRRFLKPGLGGRGGKAAPASKRHRKRRLSPLAATG